MRIQTVFGALAIGAVIAGCGNGPSAGRFVGDARDLGATGSWADILEVGGSACSVIGRTGRLISTDEAARMLTLRTGLPADKNMDLMYAAVDNLCPDLAGKLP
ncbi:hypothetical protein AB1484_05965 [Parafrankia sp. FMc6]|uniref:hypothetical protein n=1 Tax=Parafrankia soli TaxID=2599596 RepID=UPI0034D55AA1